MSTSIDVSALDALFSAAYPAGEPGAVVIVAQGGRPLLRKAYGMANLELGVPNAPEMVFRIGSMTKQFTAVSILMLAAEQRLGLDDPLDKFLPDYPVHGHTITIQHLLTHTSGIQSYTGMSQFEKSMRQDMTTTEMVDFFKNQPMEFAPGKRWNYNNSGYFLLGVIIEKVSGMGYQEFLQQRIFDPLGMKSTYYDSPERIIPYRASGYTKKDGVMVNDGYISMSQPYAAGALASTVDDLLAWDESLYTGRLVSLAALEQAWTPYRLLDGTQIPYGYGWGLHTYQGHRWIDHGGGIPGFLSQGIRLPAEHIYVGVLSNTTAPAHNPGELGTRAAALMVGKPVVDAQVVTLPAAALAEVEGAYEEKPGEVFQLALAEGRLKLSRAGWPDIFLEAIGDDGFIGKELGLNRLCLRRDAAGAVCGWELLDLFGEVQLKTQRTEKVV
jgi:D-alanyl-D-alanine carboxypeptidase